MSEMKADDRAYLQALERVIERVIAPQAGEIDRTGQFPSQGIQGLREAGLLGLISSPEVGGMGFGFRQVCQVIERTAQECASTAMVLMMHYAATTVIEAHGPLEIRTAAAQGRHLSTLAFSEAGSRSHFWAPTSTARSVNGHVQLDARKKWVTSAGKADSYVWTSGTLGGEGESTLWLVPADAPGLTIPEIFNGLGLRGNASSPILAEGVMISPAAMLGPDGGGFQIMMQTVLPIFQLMLAAVSIGIMEAATRKSVMHVTDTRFEHQGYPLSSLPTIRAYLARMRIKTDMARSLLSDSVDALENNREDALLRVLEVKAAAGETATEVTDLAMRVCGGAAFSKEVGVERHFRDSRAGTVMAPTTDVLYDFIGRVICGMPLFD